MFRSPVGPATGARALAMEVDCAALPRDWLDIELPYDGRLSFSSGPWQVAPDQGGPLLPPRGRGTASATARSR
ncbi:hypothetical protein EAO69_26485 [Streptomyces sp. me109]|nr:hypothetical protein EAO69_26485 [Streptomyces sp. me109]